MTHCRYFDTTRKGNHSATPIPIVIAARRPLPSTNHSWYQSSRVIALSCGIKISAVRHLVLSRCTRVTDGRTDGQTDRITTPKTDPAYARAVKMKS